MYYREFQLHDVDRFLSHSEQYQVGVDLKFSSLSNFYGLSNIQLILLFSLIVTVTSLSS